MLLSKELLMKDLFQGASTENIKMWLETIDLFNSTPEFGTTRVLFTKEELGAREYVKDEMKKIGLTVSEDAIGNIFGVLEGEERELEPVWTGSHIDTVLNAGMFDGMTGVVSGMEALRLIKQSGLKTKRDINVVVYTSEEPTRFGLCCLGSRAMAGELSYEQCQEVYDNEGNSLGKVLENLGYDSNDYNSIKKNKGEVFAAVELHVEQSSNLEKNNKTIGIVKTICAPTNFEVEVIGCQAHAGGTSMGGRCDAYAASAEIALKVEQLAKESKSEYTTATVGRVQVIPNATNVIPGRVKFSIDIRDCSYESKNILIEKLDLAIEEIKKRRNVEVNLKLENNDVPMQCDSRIIDIIEENCEDYGVSYMKTISGAYHDSMFVGKFAPVAMIFVPSKNGISHSPEEWTSYEDITKGTDILTRTLYKLANEI